MIKISKSPCTQTFKRAISTVQRDDDWTATTTTSQTLICCYGKNDIVELAVQWRRGLKVIRAVHTMLLRLQFLSQCIKFGESDVATTTLIPTWPKMKKIVVAETRVCMYPSMHWAGGACPEGGVCRGGVCLGVSAQRVSAQGVCLPKGGVCPSACWDTPPCG